ncbi:hypothetical protein J7I08_004190 [Vibrio vulnificus]|nr:hypothetical protein [Vibrio vulnificus]
MEKNNDLIAQYYFSKEDERWLGRQSIKRLSNDYYVLNNEERIKSRLRSILFCNSVYFFIAPTIGFASLALFNVIHGHFSKDFFIYSMAPSLFIALILEHFIKKRFITLINDRIDFDDVYHEINKNLMEKYKLEYIGHKIIEINNSIKIKNLDKLNTNEMYEKELKELKEIERVNIENHERYKLLSYLVKEEEKRKAKEEEDRLREVREEKLKKLHDIASKLDEL